jgi:hypothetical protein
VFVRDSALQLERVAPFNSGINIRGDIRNAVIVKDKRDFVPGRDKLVIGINNQQPLVYSLQQ